MAEFSKLVITENGQALLAKMIAGTGDVEFSSVRTSSTTYAESALESLTSLSNIKQTAEISKITTTNDTAVQIEAAFTNTDLTTGYYIRTIGLYAEDPDDGTILYAVTIDTSGTCYMPAYNNVSVSGLYVKLVTTVGNSDSVSLEVDSAAVATVGDIEDLQSQIDDLMGYIGYTDDDIYGVEVDFSNKTYTRLAGATSLTGGEDFDDINMFGGRKRCILADDGTVLAYYGDTAFTTTGQLTEAVTIGQETETDEDTGEETVTNEGTTYAVGTNVQVMVEQPKFYYKVVPLELEKSVNNDGDLINQVTRKVRYYVSDIKKSGFEVHPAFVEDGNENNYIYLSAFEGCLWDASAEAYILDDSQVLDTTADMLSSIANAIPASGYSQSMTLPNTRTIAENRGSGWELQYAAVVAATQLLMLIEYASFNMQTEIGSGVTSVTDDGETNMAEPTGATVNLGNDSGTAETSGGYTAVSYRGEENLWGNIWKWVDGINIYNGTTFESGDFGHCYIADHDFACNSSADPYEDTGLFPPYMAWTYFKSFCYSEDYDWLFMPGESGGNSTFPGDCFQNVYSGWRVARLGASWGSGSNAGPFCWSLDGSSSGRRRDFGGRPVYIPSKNA